MIHRARFASSDKHRSLTGNKLTKPAVTFLTLLLLALGVKGLWPHTRAAAVVQNSVTVTSVSAASFVGAPALLAPNSIVAAFGTELAMNAQTAASQPLPTSLAGTNVTINGAPAPLFFVSPGQVNYLIPPGTPAGDAQVVITAPMASGDQIISRGTVRVAATAPAIFTANANGVGAPAALTGRISGGQFVFDANLPFEPDPVTPGQVVPAPIDAGTAENPAFLVLFGTGLRDAPANSVSAIIGGLEVPVTPTVAPDFTGLDQVNVPIPLSLKGRGNVNVAIVAAGVSSNPVTINLAGTAGALAINSFSINDGALAGQTVTIQGSGFATTPEQNIVRFGGAQARVIVAASNQLSVIVPFNAESGRVVVQTPQGEARSATAFRVRTSFSGIVQSTGSATAAPAPLEGVTLRVVGSNVTARTNTQGTFIIPDLAPGSVNIEVDGGTTGDNPPYPRTSLKPTVRPDRDNHLVQPVSLQQIIGGSATVGGPGFTAGAGSSATAGKGNARSLIVNRATAALRDQQTALNPQPLTLASQLPTARNIVITDRNVTLEVPLGANVRFPDGKTSGQVQLTVLERSRLPGINLPVGVYSSTIAQITPLGTTFSPGASISFPNPDSNNLPPGAKVDLYRYDFAAGAFIKRGTATVSADRARVVSDNRVVDLASFWFAAVPSGVTTVWGKVVDSFGRPLAGAQVTVNGRSDISDDAGGFTIADVATAGIAQIQAEAVLPQQYGVVPRGTSQSIAPVVGGVTNMGTIALSDTNQPGLVFSPLLINFDSNSSSSSQRVEVTLTQPAPSGGLTVSLISRDPRVATVPATVIIPAGQTTAGFNVTRVGPGVTLIEARATLAGNALLAQAVVTVPALGPTLTGVNPTAAPPGARITITGSGLSSIADNNLIGFVRDGQLNHILDPKQNEVTVDSAGRVSLRVSVPGLSPGPVSIVATVIDDLTRVISDPSAPLNFTITASNLAAPQLAGVAPAQGQPRDTVAINGAGFGPHAAENVVLFRQGLLESQARISAVTATQLVVEVPAQDITRGPATIVVRRQAASGASSSNSNALDFTITADPQPPARPTLAAVVNALTGAPAGRDGDTIRAQGSGLGRNFYNSNTKEEANDEPLLTLLLFYQNTQLAGIGLPTNASGGTQLIAVIPSGLNAGATLITAVNFDLETGLVSEESAPVGFTITVGSLRRINEDEPNDSPETATELVLPIGVDGQTARTDPGELIVRFSDGTTERLHDLYALKLDRDTVITISLLFAPSADLDLFVLEKGSNSLYRVVFSSTNNTGTAEGLFGTLRAGEFLIAVGAFNGASRYSLELRQGAGLLSDGLVPLVINDAGKLRHPAWVEQSK